MWGADPSVSVRAGSLVIQNKSPNWKQVCRWKIKFASVTFNTNEPFFTKIVCRVCFFTSNTVLSPLRFIHVAPQYFFYNLPTSESKDILQSILNDGAPQYQEAKPPTSQEEPVEDQTHDRCVMQWLSWPTVLVRKLPAGTYCTLLHRSTSSG